MYLIYEEYFLLFAYDLLLLSIYSYYFVFLLFVLYIFHLFFFFLCFLFLYISPSIFYLYVFFILWFFPLRIFCFVLPENFIFVFLLLVYVYGYKFVLFASYKKRSSISEPLFSLFYFFEEFRCCSKIFCFSKFLFSLFYSLFQSLGACLEPLPASLNSNHKSLLSFVPMDVSHS